MTGPQQLAAATGWTSRPTFVLAIGTIVDITDSYGGDGMTAVIDGILDGHLPVPAAKFSSVFAAEVARHVTALAGTNIIGRRVELHFIDNQFFIAYTLGG